MTQQVPLARALTAEFLGSAGLSATVIGSGIAAAKLSPNDVGLQLLENAAATALGLYVLILVFGPVSGGHFNPVVSILDALLGNRSRRSTLAYLSAQVIGCVAGAMVANAMFELPAVSTSMKERASSGHALAEFLATIGLLLVIFCLARSGHGSRVAAAVGAYIGAAYFVTSSTSFANPAITIGRMFSDTFAGIAPSSAPLFVGMQLLAVPGSRDLSAGAGAVPDPGSGRRDRLSDFSPDNVVRRRRRRSYPALEQACRYEPSVLPPS